MFKFLRLLATYILTVGKVILSPRAFVSVGNAEIVQLIQSDQYARALPLAEKLLDFARLVCGESHPDFANSLNSLAGMYRTLGRWQEAEDLHRRALRIREQQLGPDHPDTADSCHNLALVYQDWGRWQEAADFQQRALWIDEQQLGPDHLDTAGSCNNLALVYQELGRWREAEDLHRRALRIREQQLGPDHPLTAQSLGNLAAVYRALGRWREAEDFQQRALRICKEQLGLDHPDTAGSCNNLALVYQDLRRWQEAEALHQRALRIREQQLGPSHPDTVASYHNLALVYKALRRWQDARVLHQRALRIQEQQFGPDHPNIASSCNDLAGVYHALGHWQDAEAWHQRALRIQEQQFGPDHPGTATSYHNLALVYQDWGRWQEAEDFHQRALRIQKQQFGPDHPQIASSSIDLATLYAATGRTSEALLLIQQAAAIRDRQINQVSMISSDNQRLAYLDSLAEEVDIFLSLVFRYCPATPDAVRAALDLVLRRKAIAAEALAVQHNALRSKQYPELESQSQKVQECTAQLAHLRRHFPTAREELPFYRERLAQLEAERDRLEADLVRQIPEMDLEQRLRDATHTAIARVLPPGAVLIEVVRFNEYGFTAVPARGERLWQPARYLAFVLPANPPEDVRMIDLGPADEVDTLVEAFRKSIEKEGKRRGAEQHQSPHVQSRADGHALRQKVFDPLQTALNGCTRLFLSPDGGLAHLPFEVLPMADGHFLLDTYDISYLSVGRDVLRFDAPSSRTRTDPLVIANPDFNLHEEQAPADADTAPSSVAQEESKVRQGIRKVPGKVQKLDPLPAAQVEGERIAQLLGVKAWIGHEARKSILTAAQSPGIVHTSTHGLFLNDQEYRSELNKFADGQQRGSDMMDGMYPFSRPGWENPMLRSMLALAGFNTWFTRKPLPEDAGDGLATGEDVSGLNLLHTDMVVLSLCFSGLGNYRRGEGVFGLRRAFVLAGAKTLVMSLWAIDDLASAVLMERFYQCLLHDRMPRLDALHAAQRYTREVTVGQLKRGGWLNEEMIAQLAGKDEKRQKELHELAQQPDEHRPYQHPFFWGAFICQGDTRLLPLSEA